MTAQPRTRGNRSATCSVVRQPHLCELVAGAVRPAADEADQLQHHAVPRRAASASIRRSAAPDAIGTLGADGPDARDGAHGGRDDGAVG